MDLEALLTRPEGFWLETATPVQRALCRVISGMPLAELGTHPDVVAAFGGVLPPGGQPRELVVLAAIRSAKTLIAAATAVWATQTADLSRIRPGEIPRFSIMSTARDQAKACMDHLKGSLLASPIMRRWLAGDPTEDTVLLKSPSGKVCEIKVVAGSKAGSTLVARWSIGAVFDEAPRMAGVDDAVVNLDEARRAILGRVLRGCPLLYIGSPWAPFGPIYDWTQDGFGRPNALRVIVRAPGPVMNPFYFTPEQCEEIRQQDAVAYQTDVLGMFADADEAFFPLSLVDAATRESSLPIPAEERRHYVAAMDPATRTNAWTFVVTTVDIEGLEVRHTVVYAKQWLGKVRDRKRPTDIIAEISGTLREYGIDEVHTDQYSADVLQDIADEKGLTLIVHDIGRADKYDQVADLKTVLSEGLLSIPNEADLRKDLQMVRRKVTQDGVAVHYPKTPDGRHCDYVPALALCVAHPPAPPDEKPTYLDVMQKRRVKLREQAEKDPIDQIEARLLGRA